MAPSYSEETSFAYVSFSYRALKGESEGRPISRVKISCFDIDSLLRASFEPFEHVSDTWVFALPHGNYTCTTAAAGHYTLRFQVIISEIDAAHSISISQNFYLLPLQHGLRMFTLWQLRERHVRIEPRLNVIFPNGSFTNAHGLGLSPLSPSSHLSASKSSTTHNADQEKGEIAHLKEKLGEETKPRFSELDANSTSLEGPKHYFSRGLPASWLYYTHSEAGYGADVLSIENGLPGLYRLSIELKQGSFEDADFTFFIVGGMDDKTGIKFSSNSKTAMTSTALPLEADSKLPSATSSSSSKRHSTSPSSDSKMPLKPKKDASSSSTFFWHIADLYTSVLGNQCIDSTLTTINYFGSTYGDFQPEVEASKGEAKEIHFDCESFDSLTPQDCLEPVFEYDTPAKTCSIWGSVHVLNFEREMTSTTNLTFDGGETSSLGGIVTLISNHYFSLYATLIGEDRREEETKVNLDDSLPLPSSNQPSSTSPSSNQPSSALPSTYHASSFSVFDVTLRLNSPCNPFSWSLYSLSPDLVNFPSAGNYRLRFDEKTKEYKVDALRLSLSIHSSLISDDHDDAMPHELKRRLVGVTVSLPKELSDLSEGLCTASPHQPDVSGDDSWEYDEYKEEVLERSGPYEDEEATRDRDYAHHDSAAEPTVPEPLDDSKCRFLTGMKVGSAWHATCTQDLKHKSSAEFSELTASIASFDHNYNANTYVFTTELLPSSTQSKSTSNNKDEDDIPGIPSDEGQIEEKELPLEEKAFVGGGRQFLQQRKPLEVKTGDQSKSVLSRPLTESIASLTAKTFTKDALSSATSPSSAVPSSSMPQSSSPSSSPSFVNPDSLIEPLEDSTPTPSVKAILQAMEMREYSRM